ncbi:hypothetical protein HH310_12505 [Actinoplanes sp. TBRC 11911]|uniref:hypothetical protein n=1 Tax=Actinoplanes sp. TBRC 11911 TaxID=2729386 RepID=UPI00145D3B18|nr:hypothetical protein [Actinoplanes sp. TBRC 11911]NMO52014.1 hypothetical protein [Actinoplanes sp. TBRC 11911]
MSTSRLESPRPAPRPRVDTHAPYEHTFGPDAVELAADAGLILDPWQADALHRMLAFDPKTLKWCHFEHCEVVSRQNGKGAILEARVLFGLFVLGEELIMWSAHEMKTALQGYRRFKRLVKRLGTQIDPKNPNLWLVGDRVVQFHNTNGQEAVELKSDEHLGYPEQWCHWIARSAGSGRGFSGDLNIVDESYAYTDAQHSALLPTASARPNPQFLYTSSPPLTGDTGEVMYRLRLRGDPSAPRTAEDPDWAQDPSLAYRDWGLAGDLESLDQIDLGDEENWKVSNPSLGCDRLTLEAIRREWRGMSKADFARERLGIWPRYAGGGSGLIDMAVWAKLGDPESKRHGDVALAVDVTPLRDHAAISMYGLRADGIGHVQVVAYGDGVDWVVAKLVELKRVLDPVAIGLDPKGGAASLQGELEAVGIKPPEDAEHPQRGELAMPSANEVAQATGQIIDAVRQKTLRHTGQNELTTAIANAKPRPLADAVAWGRKQSDVDISPLVSATLARWAYVTRINVKSKVEELVGSLMA